MRVFLAGATGVIGRPLVPALIAAGHQVTGMTRSPEKVSALRAAGAEAVVADALDAEAVMSAVSSARPEAIIHELTAIPQRLDPRRLERDFALNDRLRSEGTRHLVAAAQEHGVARILAQSIAFAYEPGPAGTVHGEDDPLIAHPAKQFRRSARALEELERTVLAAGGLVLRYGYFYGPDCGISKTGAMRADVLRRRLPIVGGGGGRVVVRPHRRRRARDRRGPQPGRARALQHRRRRPSAGVGMAAGPGADAREPSARTGCRHSSPGCWPGSTVSRS